MSTHEVENVPPPLPEVNRFTTDAVLMTAGFEPGEAEQLDELGDPGGDRAGQPSGDGWRTATRPCCARMTASAIASTRSSSIPPGTN